MDKKDKLLTIGQFAALHGINKKTLMWYDEIDLFKPAAINPENCGIKKSLHLPMAGNWRCRATPIKKESMKPS